jgi:hypothetical protein
MACVRTMLAVNPIDIEVFSDMRGLSSRNLLAMKIFAREFSNAPIAQQPVAQLPWGHVLQLLQRVKNPAVRDFYIQQTLTHGWSRSILEIQIGQQLHLRIGKAQNNFSATLPPSDSDLAVPGKEYADEQEEEAFRASLRVTYGVNPK